MDNESPPPPEVNKLAFLTPIIVVICFSALLTIIGFLGQLNLTAVPFSEEEGGFGAAIMNAFIFLLIALVGGISIYLLIKYKKDIILKLFFGIAVWFSWFFMWLFYGWSIISYLNLGGVDATIAEIGSLCIGGGSGVLSAYVMTAKGVLASYRNIVLIIYSALIGSFLALTIPTWSVILILLFISAYDIFAVKKGPIKEIVKLSEERQDSELSLTFTTRDWEIGLGDLAFYSLLSSHALALFDIITWGFVSIGILIGSVITLWLLTKKEMLPGLPISIGLGVIPLILRLIL